MPITDSEKARRRGLLKAHYDVENSHNMNAIMATFSPDGEMLYNRIPFTDPQSIRDAHEQGYNYPRTVGVHTLAQAETQLKR